MTNTALIKARDLSKHYTVSTGRFGAKGVLKAVDAVDIDVHEGETLGLVGESGCGKTTLGRLILRLIEASGGSIEFAGVDLTALPQRLVKPYRKDIQFIFQDPYASLNPRMTVGTAIRRNLDIHGIGQRRERPDRVASVLRQVGLMPEHAGRYPHEFSGGQRQRIAIARALATEPRLIIADEPTSALDVSIQAQILELLQGLKEKLGLTLMFISHDMGVVRQIADRVAVMYLGKIVEIGSKEAFFAKPLHPYSVALRGSVPVPDPRNRETVPPLEGEVPSPLSPPSGCRFHPRCTHRMPRCRDKTPHLRPSGERDVACFLY